MSEDALKGGKAVFAYTLMGGVQQRVWVRRQVEDREGCFTNEGKGDSGRRRNGDNDKRVSAEGWVVGEVTRLLGEKKRVGVAGRVGALGELPSSPPSSFSVTQAKPPSTCTSCSTMTLSRSIFQARVRRSFFLIGCQIV